MSARALPITSEPEDPFGQHERHILENLKDGIRHSDRDQSGVTLGEHMAIVGALAEINRLTAELAALAPLQDLLLDVREDDALRRAAEIGAARERGACAATCDGYAEGPLHAGLVNESAVLLSAANKIRRRGPCLSPPLEEKELERLRMIETKARALMQFAIGTGAPALTFAANQLREALGMPT